MGNRTLFVLNLILVFALAISLFYTFSSDEGGERSKSLLGIAQNTPEASYFMENFKVSKIQGYILSKDYVKGHIEELREKCGEEFRVGKYWKFQYKTPGNKDLTLWLDPAEEKVICVEQDFLNRSESGFAMLQKRSEIEATQGGTVNEKLYFYSLEENRTYYVSVKVSERPGWDFKMEPILRSYEPLDKSPVRMNLKVESSSAKLRKPEEYPSGVEYIKPKGLGGYVRSKFIKWQLEVPKPSPITGKGVTGKFDVVFNVTTKYFRGNEVRVLNSRNVSYTVAVNPR